MAYEIQPKKAKFDPATGFAIIAGWTEVYHYSEITKEFGGASYEFIYEGVSLPAHSCGDAPNQAPEGKAIIRQGEQWVHVNDYRGQKIYLKETGLESVMREIGDIPDNYTLLKPGSEFDIWNGEKWVFDTEKQHQYYVKLAKEEKAELIYQASEQITYRQDAVDAEIATDEEVAVCEAWKKYRVLLNRIDVNDAPNINWPQKP